MTSEDEERPRFVTGVNGLISSDKVVLEKSTSVLSILLGYQLKGRERRKSVVLKNRVFFLYFIFFICKFYKGQANRYHNASLNNFYIIKGCTHTHTQDKEGKKKKKNRCNRSIS